MTADNSKTLLFSRRWVGSEATKLLHEARLDQGRPSHVSPGSTLIAAMGQHWHPGSMETVIAMAQHTADAGYEICCYEEHDRCYLPYDAMGVMRNLAYMKALEEGWEYLLYVDNDVLPNQDALVKLLQRPVPIVSPIIVYSDGEAHGLTMPLMERNRGLAMVTSCVLSFLLVRATVFLPWASGGFWENPLGADESYHFAKLRMTGHMPFVDSDVVVACQSPPHYPLDSVGPCPSARVGRDADTLKRLFPHHE